MEEEKTEVHQYFYDATQDICPSIETTQVRWWEVILPHWYVLDEATGEGIRNGEILWEDVKDNFKVYAGEFGVKPFYE